MGRPKGAKDTKPRKKRDTVWNKIDLSGQKFGKWTVISQGKKTDRIHWKCKCECGEISEISTSHLKSGKSTQCRKCSKTNEKNWDHLIGCETETQRVLNVIKKDGVNLLKCECKCQQKTISYIPPSILHKKKKCKYCCNWKGYEEISGSYFTSLKREAKYRKIEFNLNIEYLWSLYLKQNKKCALSGVKLYFYRSNKEKQSASLDRIDNSKGYIEGNVQWVHKDINMMKHAQSQSNFINWCNLVSKNMGNL